MVISVDRFMGIYLRYQEYVTYNRIFEVIILLWVISAFLWLVTLWVPTSISFVLSFATIEVGCLVTTTFLNYKIYSAVRRHRNQIQALPVQQIEQNDEMTNVASVRKLNLHLEHFTCISLSFLPQICSYAAMAISEVSVTIKGLFYM